MTNQSDTGDTVWFPAVVTNASPVAGSPSGVVNYYFDNQFVASLTLAGQPYGSQTSYSTAGLPAGNHAIVAQYSGPGTQWAPCSAGVNWTVTSATCAGNVSPVPTSGVSGANPTTTSVGFSMLAATATPFDETIAGQVSVPAGTLAPTGPVWIYAEAPGAVGFNPIAAVNASPNGSTGNTSTFNFNTTLCQSGLWQFFAAYQGDATTQVSASQTVSLKLP